MANPPTIRAAEAPSSLRIEATAPVEIRAAASEGKRPTFDIMGYTGAPMKLAGFLSPVIVDLTGLTAAGPEIPALRDHDTGRVIGQTESVTIDATGARFVGTITGENADASEITTHARNGFKWRASIGAGISSQEFLKTGETATVNGRTVAGPMLIARRAVLQEISFVAIGADGATSASVAASQSLGSQKGAQKVFDTWLQAKGIDPATITDSVRDLLHASYEAGQAPKPTPPPAPAAPPEPIQAKGLDEIFAEQRKEQKRVDEITRITAEAIRERPMMLDSLEKMSRTAIEAKVASRDYELEVLRATRAQAGAPFAIHSADPKVGARTLEAALCMAGGLDNYEKAFDERTLTAAHERYRHGLGLNDVLSIVARENGWSGHSVKGDIPGVLRAAFQPGQIQAQGWSTISLSNILGNTANKFLAAGFNGVETSWREIAARRSVNDLKQITSAALTGGFTYEKVGPGGEIKHATASEIAYTNQAETYARMFAVTRTQILNDDLNALSGIPRKLGRGAALALNRDVFTVFMNNAAFFTAGRLNYSSGAGSVLAIPGLTTAETGFLNQVDPDGDPVGVSPQILLVPNALGVTAATLMNSTTIAGDTTANTLTFGSNPHAGKYKIVQSSYLSNANITGFSTTAWYLLANPADLPVLEVAFLNGKEMPTVESADADFNTLGIQFRGYFDYGAALQEYRAGYKMAGA